VRRSARFCGGPSSTAAGWAARRRANSPAPAFSSRRAFAALARTTPESGLYFQVTQPGRSTAGYPKIGFAASLRPSRSRSCLRPVPSLVPLSGARGGGDRAPLPLTGEATPGRPWAFRPGPRNGPPGPAIRECPVGLARRSGGETEGRPSAISSHSPPPPLRRGAGPGAQTHQHRRPDLHFAAMLLRGGANGIAPPRRR
jgi:hypothetical protein